MPFGHLYHKELFLLLLSMQVSKCASFTHRYSRNEANENRLKIALQVRIKHIFCKWKCAVLKSLVVRKMMQKEHFVFVSLHQQKSHKTNNNKYISSITLMLTVNMNHSSSLLLPSSTLLHLTKWVLVKI